jgi:hypothetical protein
LRKRGSRLLLDLSVAGGVLCESGAEVGAARVAAAQRALDVGGAQVVVELGFGERAEEGVALVRVARSRRVRGTDGSAVAEDGALARGEQCGDEEAVPLR